MQKRGGGGGERPAVRKGAWTAEEDEVLLQHVREHGPQDWSSIRSKDLLPRTGKSCRLRWVNKLRPNLKTGCKFSPEEERLVIDMQAQFGNRWARIATYLPGRTDNDVKNFWSTRQKRLARILRAPLPRRRPGKQSRSASSAPSHDLPAQKPLRQGPCSDMIPFQETTHHIGQSSSQEPCTENQCADAPFAGLLGLELLGLPSPVEFAMDVAVECGSSSAAPTARPPFGSDAGDPVSGVAPPAFVDHARFVDAASLQHDAVAYLEPLAVVPPAPFFGLDDDYGNVGSALHQDMSGVLFDDLPPEAFDFFELPPSPPPFPPPSPSPAAQM
ncbi:probable transcription factor MYB58 [Phragmites australis]|uniref:probable transcription factor MYB58 n=1 Tax=Phragmites australis TaxID=29695 RepID=UPI002D76E179|nr:probable transcription factor MYB58 [Phragmites australis]